MTTGVRRGTDWRRVYAQDFDSKSDVDYLGDDAGDVDDAKGKEGMVGRMEND